MSAHFVALFSLIQGVQPQWGDETQKNSRRSMNSRRIAEGIDGVTGRKSEKDVHEMRPLPRKQQQKKYVNGRVHERQGIDPIKNKRLQKKTPAENATTEEK